MIHCGAFRRLEYKTQVFVNHEGDHFRTRLTHTLEVSQIARTIARTLRLNEDLTEAISLAHDLGHTPFGHSGEDVLHSLLAADGGFEHNLQSLRVVESLEERYPGFPGLNLTFEVRESIAKHSKAWGWKDVPAPLREYGDRRRALLEAQAADIADSIAYDNHDIDDGLAYGILDEEGLRATVLWQEALASAEPGLSPKARRHQAVVWLINAQVSDLVGSTAARLADARVRSVDDVRSAPGPLVGFSEGMAAKRREMAGYLFENFYRNFRLVRMARKACDILTAVFRRYAEDPCQLPPEHQARAKREGVRRAVADYVAGMTDRFVQDEYKRLFWPFERI